MRVGPYRLRGREVSGDGPSATAETTETHEQLKMEFLPLWRWDAWGWRQDEACSLATSWTGTRSHPETQTIIIVIKTE